MCSVFDLHTFVSVVLWSVLVAQGCQCLFLRLVVSLKCQLHHASVM